MNKLKRKARERSEMAQKTEVADKAEQQSPRSLSEFVERMKDETVEEDEVLLFVFMFMFVCLACADV